MLTKDHGFCDNYEMKRYIKTPIGILQPYFLHESLIGLRWSEETEFQYKDYSPREQRMMDEMESQLNEYFAGQRSVFQIDITISGTEFQNKVWNALRTIPYGETRTYQEIAEQINAPRAARAVGQANRCNPFSIIIPCHRVLGVNGKLTGYMGSSESGLNMKRFLLDLEQSQCK